MDCEQVFATLTRGPFPTGRACDADVERHLAECDGCRAFAAALAPNDREPASRAASRLPCYRGAAIPIAARATARSAGGPAALWPHSPQQPHAGRVADLPGGLQLASVTLPDRTASNRGRFYCLVGASALAVAAWAALTLLV